MRAQTVIRSMARTGESKSPKKPTLAKPVAAQACLRATKGALAEAQTMRIFSNRRPRRTPAPGEMVLPPEASLSKNQPYNE